MKKILIVDDEPHVSVLLKQFLERTGYQVFTALNGEQALTQIENSTPDIMITDAHMPKMNGIQLCEMIYHKLPQPQFLIIMMSSKTDADIRHCLETYPQILLMEKPLSMNRLTVCIKDYFEHMAA